MFFWGKKTVAVEETGASRVTLDETALLKEAYRVGRFSPSNCECPPAPDIIPVWVDNNVESLEFYSNRFFDRFEVAPELEPRMFIAMFQGFRDLIHACPDGGSSSPFCMKADDIVVISKDIFRKLAAKKGITLSIPD